MRYFLKNQGDRYVLYGSDDSKIASTSENPFGRLSKENCDEIFGVVDIEKLADEYFLNEYSFNKKNNLPYKDSDVQITKNDFKNGFNKAMELQKDKLFTVEDMRKLHDMIMCNIAIRPQQNVYDPVPTEKYIQSLLQQPTEIEVEIEMNIIPELLKGSYTEEKLDGNGCLILKKI